MTPYETFWFFLKERYSIFKKRQRGEKAPWTTDATLQQYRFCNVFREDDKVTIWIRKNWREPYKGHPNLWFAMAVARQINKVETLQRLGFPVQEPDAWKKHALKVLGAMDEDGERIYGGAYIITAGGVSGPKYLYTVNKVLFPSYAYHYENDTFGHGYRDGIKNTWTILREGLGFGPFIAYEVATDLRWTRYYDGSDHMTWANAGPGAKRGLGRIFYNDEEHNITPDECLELMQKLLKDSETKWKKLGLPHPLEMRDIEHSLCEVDKYLRVWDGRRMKCKYNGTGMP
jgi:hypothetical protein